MADLLLRGGTVLTLGEAGVMDADVYVDNGTIVGIGAAPSDADVVLDVGGMLVVPGFVQAHVHLCQTLMRGVASGVDVVDWLRETIWPLESSHTASTMRASARLGIAELLLSGTTAALTMESVGHTDEVFRAARELGLRATIGKALMDRREPGTGMIGETTDEALGDLRRLVECWHGNGRLRVAASPRAPRAGSNDLWRHVVDLAADADLVLHTHVNENRDQSDRVAQGEGRDIEVLDGWGALGPRLVMAHSVWLDDTERALVRRRRPHVCHCPSGNLKLASGFAPVPELLADGINVALGSDGAACNDRLDMFSEMRLAAMLHLPRCGANALSAQQVVRMATIGGARALGIDALVGTVELGKRADLIVVRRDRCHLRPWHRRSPYEQLVFAATSADVHAVVIDGDLVVNDGHLLTGDTSEIAADAEIAAAALDRAQQCRR